MRTQRW